MMWNCATKSSPHCRHWMSSPRLYMRTDGDIRRIRHLLHGSTVAPDHTRLCRAVVRGGRGAPLEPRFCLAALYHLPSFVSCAAQAHTRRGIPDQCFIRYRTRATHDGTSKEGSVCACLIGVNCGAYLQRLYKRQQSLDLRIHFLILRSNNCCLVTHKLQICSAVAHFHIKGVDESLAVNVLGESDVL